MIPAEPLKLLKREGGKVFRLELRNEIFLSVYFRDGGFSVGLWLPSAVVGTPKTIDLLRRASLAVGHPPEAVVVKAVGPRDLVARAEEQFAKAGVKRVEARPREGAQELLFYPETGRVRVASIEENRAVAPKTGKTKVLIVDDSKTIRSLLEKILIADPGIEIVGSIEKPSLVEEAIRANRPDVITMDIHMPEMDGVKLLKRLLPRYPIPTVMISSISMEEGPMVLSALEAGAVDYVQKPTFDQIAVVAPLIVEKVKNAAQAKVHVRTQAVSAAGPKVAKSTVKADCDMRGGTVVAIGSSTGGTEALRQVLTQLPREIPPIVIVQHIPPVFSKAFAMRMNELCPFEVKEAQSGDAVVPNRVLIAPGGTQMKLVKSRTGYAVEIDPNAAPVNRHKPSVDVLFDSVAQLIADRAIGVILTGMGADGAQGLLKMLKAGARTLGQDEATCVVYGMPQAAFKLGAVQEQLPLGAIAGGIVRLAQTSKKAA